MGVIFLMIGVAALLIAGSFISAKLEANKYFTSTFDFNNFGSMFFLALAILDFSIALGLIISAGVFNATKASTIYARQQTRAHLVETYNLYRVEHKNDLIHFETIKDISKEIAGFNAMLYDEDFFNDDPWIGCFYIGSGGIEKIVIEDGVAK